MGLTPSSLSSFPLQLQEGIGAKNACAFDLTAACSGFVMGLITAGQYIRTGAAKKVLVVGGDALSRFVDWRDRGESCTAESSLAACPENPLSVLGGSHCKLFDASMKQARKRCNV